MRGEGESYLERLLREFLYRLRKFAIGLPRCAVCTKRGWKYYDLTRLRLDQVPGSARRFFASDGCPCR